MKFIPLILGIAMAILVFPIKSYSSCSGQTGESLKVCQQEEVTMLSAHHRQKEEKLKKDRQRVVTFHFENTLLSASVGELLDLSPQYQDRGFYYSQATREESDTGGKNVFDVIGVCKKFSHVEGKVTDSNIEFTCKKGQLVGEVRFNPSFDRDFLIITTIQDGKISESKTSRKGIVYSRSKYFAPNWYVEEKSNDGKSIYSRQEVKNGKLHGLNFYQDNDEKNIYRDGKIIKTFKSKDQSYKKLLTSW